jgi:hypothetical protein
MAQVQVWLSDWEHRCCGDQRSVGQEIELSVDRSRSRFYEQRHDYAAGGSGGPVAVPMRGRVLAIAWHRAVMDRTGMYASRRVGYAPGVACESTEISPATSSWAFEFTIETESDLPVLASTPELDRSPADAAVYITLDWDPFHDEESEEFPPRWFGYVDYGDDGPDVTEGPFFSDALEAVRWWRGRSSRIYLRLEEGGAPLWAGEGPAPETDDSAAMFDEHDRRVRPEGTRQAARSRRASRLAGATAEKRQQMAEDGLHLRDRRIAAGVSVNDLALRMGAEPSWIEGVESGEIQPEKPFSTWVDFVWATTEPWPQARAEADKLWEDSESAGLSVVSFAPAGGHLRQAERQVARHIRGPSG